MILRKPYAFFIRMFKPINFILSILVAYLIYFENRILSFFNSYIYSATNVVGTSIKDSLAPSTLFILPIIIIILSMIILGVMFRKKKPTLFYVINIFIFIVVIIINLYVSNFLGVLEKSVVSIRIVKLMHDLIIINMALESFSFIILIVRGMGINFKKFDFDSEIAKFNINESDKEEFELNINVDLNQTRTDRKRKLRYLKYRYKENKLIINSIIVVILIIIGFIVYLVFRPVKYNTEGTIYTASTFNFVVDETLLLDTDYRGNKITDNTIVVVKTRMNSFINSNSLYLRDFTLKIGDAIFKPTTEYSNYLIDIGNAYDESILLNEYNNYLFIYEIPEKYTASDMLFRYNDVGVITEIKLNPKIISRANTSIQKNIDEEISFNESLGDIKFKINDYEIKDKYLLQYNYCVKDNDCIKSIEYLRPTLNTNFDKYILRLNLDYSDNSNLKVNTFYKFFSKFGSISYKINDNWYVQSTNFEEIKSNKANTGKNVYIGINSDIAKASSIKLTFNIRGSIYEYILK